MSIDYEGGGVNPRQSYSLPDNLMTALELGETEKVVVVTSGVEV